MSDLINDLLDYFDPAVISFGPYRYGKRELQEIDNIKDEAMLKFIKESGKSFLEFYYKVRNMNHLTRITSLELVTLIVWKKSIVMIRLH